MLYAMQITAETQFVHLLCWWCEGGGGGGENAGTVIHFFTTQFYNTILTRSDPDPACYVQDIAFKSGSHLTFTSCPSLAVKYWTWSRVRSKITDSDRLESTRIFLCPDVTLIGKMNTFLDPTLTRSFWPDTGGQCPNLCVPNNFY